MRALRLMSVCLAVSLFAIPAMAEVAAGPSSFFDVFYVALGGDSRNWNQVVPEQSGGSGFHDAAGQAWFPYESNTNDPSQRDPWGGVNPVPGWKNQWFYDGVYDPTRYKVVDVNFDYALLNPTQPGGTDIVINWSTPAWSLLTRDPADPLAPPMTNNGPAGEPYVGRAVVSTRSATAPDTWLEIGEAGGYFSATFDLRDYGVPFNPEWVSIDIAGYNIQLSSPDVPGSFNHRCIPEPGMLALLITGAIGLLAYAWRRRR